jgi:hypothetical protein
MNLAEIRDLVRAEANIGGLQEYQTLIDFIINQELLSMTGKSRYDELREEVTFTSSVDATYQFNLPSDFQLIESVTYKRPSSDPDFTVNLSKGTKNLWKTQTIGFPQYFKRISGQLIVYPYTDFLAQETLDLVYFKKQILIQDTDELLVTALEKPLIQFTMARMLRMTDTKRAQFAQAAGEEAWKAVRVENAGN